MRTPARGGARLRRSAVAVAAAACCLVGCGSSSHHATAARGSTPPPVADPQPGGRDAVRAVAGWSDALRRGDVARASAFFAVPSVVENASPPVRLTTAREVAGFNASLPCGAELVRTQPLGQYTVATFKLTDRPGGDCGAAVGQLAATAFLVRAGKFTQWLRVEVPKKGSRAPAPSPPAPAGAGQQV